MSKFSTDINLTDLDFGSSQSRNFLLTQGTGTPSGFFVSGEFENGTFALQHKIGDTWVNVGEDTTLTENGGGLFTTPISELRVRATGVGVGDAYPETVDVRVIVKPLYL